MERGDKRWSFGASEIELDGGRYFVLKAPSKAKSRAKNFPLPNLFNPAAMRLQLPGVNQSGRQIVGPIPRPVDTASYSSELAKTKREVNK